MGGNDTITYIESNYRIIAFMNQTTISIPEYNNEVDTIS